MGHIGRVEWFEELINVYQHLTSFFSCSPKTLTNKKAFAAVSTDGIDSSREEMNPRNFASLLTCGWVAQSVVGPKIRRSLNFFQVSFLQLLKLLCLTTFKNKIP